MMIRRFFFTTALLLIGLFSSGLFLLTGNRLESSLNRLLPEKWQIMLPQAPEFQLKNAKFPALSVIYQDCQLITLSNFSIQWQTMQLTSEKVVMDYACLVQMSRIDETSDNDNSSIEWQKWLSLIPKAKFHIHSLEWQNLPEELPFHLYHFLATPSQITLKVSPQYLNISLHHQQGILTTQWQDNQLNVQLDYQPRKEERHQLQLHANTPFLYFALPTQLKAEYQWQLPEFVINEPTLQKGHISLEGKHQDTNFLGTLKIYSALKDKNQLIVPFWLDQHSIQIERAHIHWQWLDDFPINAYINAKLTPKAIKNGDWFPLESQLRISLLSQSTKGKGNIVIQIPNGIIEKERLFLPLQINGEIKYHDFILYSAVPIELKGQWENATLYFLPSSLLRLVGKTRFLTIQDLRFPLAGIRVDKHGINGRLQAIFKGESPDFHHIEFHLDGYAKAFHAGQSFFQKSDNELQNQWNWRFWSGSTLHSLGSQLSLSGRGRWKENLVTLSEFNGELTQIKQGSVTIPKTELNLLTPIKFAYEKFYVDGAVRLQASQIHFNYGGRLNQPTADLSFNGETEKLQLKGTVNAGKLGPIRLFARRQLTDQSSHISGKLYWLEQSADVFQSFFPTKMQYLITHGTVKGETAFSFNDRQGFIAGGHFSLKDGAISLPNGEIKGIQFSLPYRYHQNQFNLGQKKPIEIRVDKIDMGLPIHHFRAKVQGYYPYNRRKPLRLSELSFKILGGTLNVARFSLPQTNAAEVRLQNISLAEILEFAQYHQLQLEGKIDAVLPFWLNGKPCYICNGKLEQVGESTLTFTPVLIEAIKQAGYTERILAHTVNHSRLKQLNATLNLASNGEMQLRTQIHSQLIENEKTKINLNYNHTENMFDLWRSINYSSQLENQLEHSIYQKWDKKSK